MSTAEEIISLIDEGWDSYDEWACALGSGFALCNAVQLMGQEDRIPASLSYRAAAGGPEDPTLEDVEAGLADYLTYELNQAARKMTDAAPLLEALAVIEARIDAVPEERRY